MTRLFIGSAALLVASVAASAGQIEIGQYVGNSSSGATQGLTSNYITGSASCVGAIFQGNTCATTGSKTGWSEANYNTSLFSSATSTSGTVSPSAYTGYSATSTSAGSQASGGGANFAMINDTSGTQNEWSATTATQPILTIPVGILDVDSAWLMLNNVWGQANQQNTDVYFTFGSTSNATAGLTVLEEELVNAPATSAGGSGGQVQSALSCLGTGSAFAICQNLAGGATLASSTPVTICSGPACADFGLSSGTNATGLTVNTSGVYTGFQYTNAVNLDYVNTSGNLQLDDQKFNFGTGAAGLYLVSIGVQETHDLLTNGNANDSATVLSAATIDTYAASTPEPSTWMLVMSGVALLGIGRLRRRFAAASSRS